MLLLARFLQQVHDEKTAWWRAKLALRVAGPALEDFILVYHSKPTNNDV